MSLSIIVTSSLRTNPCTGLPHLATCLDSITPQLQHGDEVLLSINSDCPWGHAARNQLQAAARGDHVMFMDDDDVYTSWALDAVRRGVAEEPGRIHMFRMWRPWSHEGRGDMVWGIDPTVVLGNMSTQCIVVPNHDLGTWGDRVEGDCDFIESTVANHGDPAWHEDIIAVYSPNFFAEPPDGFRTPNLTGAGPEVDAEFERLEDLRRANS